MEFKNCNFAAVVMRDVDELITVPVVCAVKVVDVVTKEAENIYNVLKVIEDVFCSMDELSTLDEMVGCTTALQ